MDLAEFRCAPYGKALKRPSKQRSKTGLQEKVTILLQNSKIIEKNLLTSDIIKSEKGEEIICRKYAFELEDETDENGLYKVKKRFVEDVIVVRRN